MEKSFTHNARYRAEEGKNTRNQLEPQNTHQRRIFHLSFLICCVCEEIKTLCTADKSRSREREKEVSPHHAARSLIGDESLPRYRTIHLASDSLKEDYANKNVVKLLDGEWKLY